MYAKYITNTTSTQADILSDVVAILTGTTDVNTLSASCNKAVTEIHSTYDAAGWELHDAAAATNVKVLKAPVYDNPSKYKYLRIDTNTAGVITLATAETWNASTHVGTNPVYFMQAVSSEAPVWNGLKLSLSQATTYFIYANVRCVTMHTNYGATWNNGQASGAPLIAEYARWSPWDTTAAAYPNWVVSGYACNGGYSNYSAYTRFRAITGSDTVQYNSGVMCSTLVGTSSPSKISNNAGVTTIPLVPLTTYASGVGHFGGNITEVCGIYATSTGLGTNNVGDELTIGGTTYIYWLAGSGLPLLTKKG